MYLLDTVVLSELRRRERNPRVVEWLASQRSSELFLSVVTRVRPHHNVINSSIRHRIDRSFAKIEPSVRRSGSAHVD